MTDTDTDGAPFVDTRLRSRTSQTGITGLKQHRRRPARGPQPGRISGLMVLVCLLWASAASAGNGVLESVEFTSNQDGIEFIVKTNTRVDPQAVQARLENDGRVVVVRMDGLAVTRRWVTARDPLLQRVMVQPDNQHGLAAAMQIRLAEPMSETTLAGARVISKKRMMRILLPRDETIAAAWISAGRGVAMGRLAKVGTKTESADVAAVPERDTRRIALPKNVPVTELPSRLHNSRKSVTDAMRAMSRHVYEQLTRWPGVRRLAVLPAHAADSLTYEERFDRVSTALLTDRLSYRDRVITVDPVELDAAMKRLRVSADGLTNDQAIALGRMYGADSVLLSTVALTTDNQVELRSRAIGLKGQVVASARQLISRKGMERVRDDIVHEQWRGSGVWRSMLMPGWGQIYHGDTGRGAAYMTSFLGLFGAAVYSVNLGSTAEKDYQKNSLGSISRRADADAHYDRVNTLLIGMGVVWAAALLDALVTGEARTDLDLGVYGVQQ